MTPHEVFTILASVARAPGAEGLRQVIDACGAPARTGGDYFLRTGAWEVTRVLTAIHSVRRTERWSVTVDLDYLEWCWGSRLCAVCRDPGDFRTYPGVRASARTCMPLCPRCADTHLQPHPRVVVVGLQSPEAADFPLLGPSGDRLRAMMGLTSQEFYAQSRVVNVVPAGAIRPSVVPRRAFLRLHALDIEPVVENMTVIALGRQVLDALDDMKPAGAHGPFLRYSRWGQTVFAVPHPSGRCRFWNDPDNREALRRLANHIYGRNA